MAAGGPEPGRPDRPGTGGPARGTPVGSRPLGARAGAPGPGYAAAGPGGDPGPRARPDQVRPDAGLPGHLLPGRCADHGVRPGRDAPQRDHRAALRGCAPVELRRVRLPGTAADLRHQRLRRDAARALGVGRQTAGGQLRDRRPRPGILPGRPARHRAGRGPRVPGAAARGGPDEDPRRVVRPSGRGSHPRGHRPGGPPRPAGQERGPGSQAGHGQGADPGQRPGDGPAGGEGGGRTPDRPRPSDHHPDRGPAADRPGPASRPRARSGT